MLAKYVPGYIKYRFTKFYRHISTNNEANRKFVIFTIPIKKILLYGDRCLTGTCCFWNYSPIGKNVCVIFVRGNPFQKTKIIQKLSVTVYYQKRLSDLDTLIKITITKIISFQHQKYSFNIKLLKLI